MFDILFRNVNIVDGSGKPAYRGSAAVKDGKVFFCEAGESAARVIDGDGLCLAPGFIDCHSHGDKVYGTDYGMLCKTAQGITTEVCGQCGSTLFPVDEESPNPSGYMSFADFIKYTESLPHTANYLQLVGHSALRKYAMGYDERPAAPAELEKMKKSLAEAMENGALGMSSGLIYSPSCYAEKEEIVELLKVVAPYDGLYATHMRNEASGVVESVKESIDSAAAAGVRLNISHHKVCGKDNWGKSAETLDLLEKSKGLLKDVWYDFYPYLASCTSVNVCLPKEALNRGLDAMREDMKNPEIRRAYAEKMASMDGRFRQCGGGQGIFIAMAKELPQAEGHTLSDYAKSIGKSDSDALFDILQYCKSPLAMYFSMGDEDMCRIAASPFAVVGTDGLVYSRSGMTHPRGYNAFPQALDYMWREKKLMTMEQAIAKMTSVTAEHLGLKTKGLIRDGFDADLLLFDPDTIAPGGSYTNPTELPKGIEMVVNGGAVVYENGALTGAAPGKFIENPRKK